MCASWPSASTWRKIASPSPHEYAENARVTLTSPTRYMHAGIGVAGNAAATASDEAKRTSVYASYGGQHALASVSTHAHKRLKGRLADDEHRIIGHGCGIRRRRSKTRPRSDEVHRSRPKAFSSETASEQRRRAEPRRSRGRGRQPA